MTATASQPTDPLDSYRGFLLHVLGHSPRTADRYESTLRQVAGHLPTGDLLAASDAQLKQVFVMGAWARGLTPRTRRAALGAVAGFYGWAVEDGLLDRSPATSLRGLQRRLPSSTAKLPTYLTVPEVQRLLDALGSSGGVPRLHGTRDQAICGVMAFAGGRLTETVQGLRVGDVDLKAGELQFRHLTKRGRQRVVFVSPLLRPLLAAWLRVREDVPSEHLFVTGRGTPFAKAEEWTHKALHPAAVRAGLQRVECDLHGRDGCRPGQRGAPGGCNRAGWRVHPHTLRHSFAVESLRSGACNIAELRDLLGHTNIATTNIYLQLVKEPSSGERFKRRFGRKGASS